MIKPLQLFGFALLVAMPLCAILWLHPKGGLHVVGDLTLQFPSFDKIFIPDTTATLSDPTEIFADIEDPEIRRQKMDSVEALRFRLHYPDDDPELFAGLFEELSTIHSAKRPLHILHFGGSQIEGDRITEHLRALLQERFGGRGPGWLPAIPYVGSRSFLIEYSDNWQRHALFGLVDSTVQHNHYGALGLYARFTAPDSLNMDTTTHQAWIEYGSRYGADDQVKTFSRFTLFYGYNTQPFRLRLLGGDHLLCDTLLQPTTKTTLFQFPLRQARRSLRLEFSGSDSPEVYGVSLEGSSGVLVSNVSLRGQSGTHFWTQPRQQLRTMFSASRVRLIILQFGANAVPYSDTEELIQEYAERFGKNIEYLKSCVPDVHVLVIGPADMAIKQGTEWVTYPMLVRIRDALKEAAFSAGAAYWDPFEAMGGAGTIQQWVNLDPPLAASDHVHFTIEGAEKIAHWFYDAFIKDYENYIQWKVTAKQQWK